MRALLPTERSSCTPLYLKTKAKSRNRLGPGLTTRSIKAARGEYRFSRITPFRIAQVPVEHNMPTEMARPFFAIQGTLLVGPEAAEMVLRLPREFNDRSRRACSRGHERRCGARSAIGRCPL